MSSGKTKFALWRFDLNVSGDLVGKLNSNRHSFPPSSEESEWKRFTRGEQTNYAGGSADEEQSEVLAVCLAS